MISHNIILIPDIEVYISVFLLKMFNQLSDLANLYQISSIYTIGQNQLIA